MTRVSVVGNAGSGKSRLARRIADVLGVPYVELDASHVHVGRGRGEDRERLEERADRARLAGDLHAIGVWVSWRRRGQEADQRRSCRSNRDVRGPLTSGIDAQVPTGPVAG